MTGHSLGGAMAALMAVMLATEEAYVPLAERWKAAYTFGQPMLGGPRLAAACHAHELLSGGATSTATTWSPSCRPRSPGRS